MEKQLKKIIEIMNDVRLNVYLDQCLEAEEIRKSNPTTLKTFVGWGKNAEIFAGYLDRIRNVLAEERKGE